KPPEGGDRLGSREPAILEAAEGGGDRLEDGRSEVGGEVVEETVDLVPAALCHVPDEVFPQALVLGDGRETRLLGRELAGERHVQKVVVEREARVDLAGSRPRG